MHEGQTFTSEEAKSDAVFDYYNAILGSRFHRQHRIDLARLHLPRPDLQALVEPFSEEEVSKIILESPPDRAPGPDGFTTRFYRAAWSVIKDDVCSTFNCLWQQDWRSFFLLNDASMVLLRKHEVPAGLRERDYRPISLIHSFGKLVSKGLAMRLTPFMNTLVSPNQTAFIKGRRIHDNFRAVQLYCRWLPSNHHPCILLKVDIAKAFDSVAWPVLLEVLECMGFPLQWRDWIAAILFLSTASTKVLTNGRLGRRICHARGLRQGDPLSPLLFVIVMEVLNALVRRADEQRLLSPLPGSHFGLRMSLYADDLVLFLKPTQEDFGCIRAILDLFAGASSLLTNLENCMISPIQCPEEAVQGVLQVFPCPQSPLPCRYLGAPLSIGRLRRADEHRLVDTIASRIPTWKGKLLNAAGRTTLTRATLSAIPVHVSITCTLSPWAIGQIDKRRRAFLWSGTDKVAGGSCKIAWLPRCYGGLGIPDLRILEFALRLRWEWMKIMPGAPAWMLLPARHERIVDGCMAAGGKDHGLRSMSFPSRGETFSQDHGEGCYLPAQVGSSYHRPTYSAGVVRIPQSMGHGAIG